MRRGYWLRARAVAVWVRVSVSLLEDDFYAGTWVRNCKGVSPLSGNERSAVAIHGYDRGRFGQPGYFHSDIFPPRGVVPFVLAKVNC